MLRTPARELGRWGVYWAKRMGLRCVDFGDRRNAVIPRFHSISDTASGNYLYAEPAICVPPRAFERQIAFLAQKYRCVSIEATEATESPRAVARLSF